eukprot:1741828-Rhodomonas_salina.5
MPYTTKKKDMSVSTLANARKERRNVFTSGRIPWYSGTVLVSAASPTGASRVYHNSTTVPFRAVPVPRWCFRTTGVGPYARKSTG